MRKYSIFATWQFSGKRLHFEWTRRDKRSFLWYKSENTINMAVSKGSGSLDFKSFKKPTGFLKLIALVSRKYWSNKTYCKWLKKHQISGFHHHLPLLGPGWHPRKPSTSHSWLPMACHHDNMWVLHHHAASPHNQSHGKRSGYPSGKFQNDFKVCILKY